MNKSQMMVSTAALEHADWNPRTEAELLPDHPEMQKLIASVRELGVVQPIAVWDRTGHDAPMLVIAGNRRFAAARAVGLSEIPAVVFTGISLAQAQEVTRVENEVRLGVDPVKDAALIGSMVSLGYSQKEIAAHFGVSEPTVCRRAKLVDLIPEIREIAVEGGITTDALERIALYPPDVQRSCSQLVARASKRAREDGSAARWSLLQWDFNAQTKDLDCVKFDTSDCASCPKRSGAQPDLWGDVSDGKLGRCLDCECFDEHHANFVRSLVVAKVGGGVSLVKLDDAPLTRYEINSESWSKFFGKTRTKSRPVAYWDYAEHAGEVSVIWGAPLETVEAEIERRAAESEAAAEERNAKMRANAERNSEVKAERERIDSERKPLEEARDALYDRVEESWGKANAESIVRREIAKLLKSVKRADVIADALVAGLSDWDFRDDHPGWSVSLAEAIPAVAKALKLKPKDFKEIAAAEKAVDDFDAANPMPEFVS